MEKHVGFGRGRKGSPEVNLAVTRRNMIPKIELLDLLMERFVEPGSTLNFF